MSVYVVVTGEPYGGGRKIQLFLNKPDADRYALELMTKHRELDVIVQQRDLFSRCRAWDEEDESKSFDAVRLGTTADGQYRVLAREGDFDKLELWAAKVGAKPQPVGAGPLQDKGKVC
jgi:hypothetical protein